MKNDRQSILQYTAAAIALLLLFPPSEIGGKLIGYSFIALQKTAQVTPYGEHAAGRIFFALLAAEIAVALIVGGLLATAAKPRE